LTNTVRLPVWGPAGQTEPIVLPEAIIEIDQIAALVPHREGAGTCLLYLKGGASIFLAMSVEMAEGRIRLTELENRRKGAGQ